MRAVAGILGLTVGLAALNIAATAQTEVTWDGDTDTNWSEAANWDTGVPGNGDVAVFPAAFTPNPPTLNVNDQVQSLRFDSANGGWMLAGTGQTLTINPADSGALEDIAIEDLATSGTTTIDATIRPSGFGPYKFVTNGGTLVLNDLQWDNGAQDLFSEGPGKTVVAKMSGSPGRMDLSGTGTLELQGPAPVGAADAVHYSGKIILGDPNALGAQTIHLRGATNTDLEGSIDLSGANAITNDIQWYAGGRRAFTGAYNITFTGTMYNATSGIPINILNELAAGKELLFTGDLAMDAREYWVTGDGITEFSGDLSGVPAANGKGGRMNRAAAGNGMLILSGTNTYEGTTSVLGGVLQLASAGALAPSQITTGGEGVIGLTAASGDFARPLSATGNVAGTVRMFEGGGFAAYGADRLVNFGGAGAGIGWNQGGFVRPTSAGGVFVLGHETADATVTLVNPLAISNGGAQVHEIMTKDGAVDVDGRLQGAVSGGSGHDLAKTGDGTLELAGDNTYPGATLVSEGTLLITGDSSAATGPVTVAPGATLGGTGIVGGATMINGALAPGASAGVLRFENDVTLDALATLDTDLGGTTAGVDYDVLDVGGMLTLGGSTLNVELLAPFSPGDGDVFDILDWGTLAGSFSAVSLPPLDLGLEWDDTQLLITGELSVAATVVPEPTVLTLLSMAALTFLATRRCR